MNRMYETLARRAILAALANDWQSALKVNLEIIENFPDDTEALNRLANAHLQLGDLDNATLFSQKVLTLDPLNNIAEKCLSRCVALAQNGVQIIKQYSTSDKLFLEIPGKTKIVSLINLCEPTTLAQLDAGDSVNLVPRMHKVAITTPTDLYIGRLPDDLANRVIYLVRCGNEYETYIKSVTEIDVKVFIKETKKSESIGQTHSFPLYRHY